MPQLSIRTRLNLLIGALLLLGLAINLALIVFGAGPRIRAEDDSIVRLSRQTVDRALAELQSSADPNRDLAALLEKLSDIRHVRLYFEPPAGRPAPLPGQVLTPSPVPDWFARLVYSERPPLRLPAIVGNRLLGRIVIASKPGDEIAEIWAALTSTLTGGLALIAAVYALTTLAVRQALMPIQDLSSALRRMRDGNYEVDLQRSGPPELAQISMKLNDLAATLSRTRSENSRLAEQIISVEDHERRELARELHDEFGPYLFAIRANVTALLADAERSSSPARAQKCQSTLDQIEALQQMNRRVLQKLRPPALSELGLDGALRSLIALWRENNPGVAIALDTVEPLTKELDETTALTVFRVVQEGLTNAFRHANASQIGITVVPGAAGRLNVTVRDNGTGIAGDSKPGFGLSGMSERVWALGGKMAMSNGQEGGVTLSVELPVSPPATRGFVAQTPASAHVSAQTTTPVAPD